MSGMSASRTNSDSAQWVTAKMVHPIDAHRYLNRLGALGYEFKVEKDNGDLRILVRQNKLNEVLDWFADFSRSQDTVKRRPKSHVSPKILIAIPFGLLIGSIFCKLLAVDGSVSIAVSSLFGFFAAILALLVFSK